VAVNGAPNCKAGADKLCQAKGFKEGKGLDTDAAEKCSAKLYLPGCQRRPGDCRTENYVTRALCQQRRNQAVARLAPYDCLVGMMSGIFRSTHHARP
jgi:hypothetical protein